MLSFSLLFYLLNLFWHLVLLYFCSISYIHMKIYALLFSSAQSISHVWLFETPWTVACQASLSITNSQSLRRLMSIELVMPSKHLILCHPLPLLPSVFPSTRGFSSKSVLCIRWPKYCSFSFSISSSNEYSKPISFRTVWFELLLSKDFQESPQTPQLESINSLALSLLYGPALNICTSLLEKS